MQLDKIANHIKSWLTNYIKDSNLDGFVVGVSGGVDSALTATLAASTGYKTLLINMPIYQQDSQFKRSVQQIKILEENYANVSSSTIDLTTVFKSMQQSYPDAIQDELTMANARARLRMTTLYAYASSNKLLVTGTGNKIEDFGVGFYTKYGDGGVDISPIADLLKSEVFQLAEYLNVSEDILNAKPTDGLWGDGRSDEDQLGATYSELEWAMENINSSDSSEFSLRQREVIAIYGRLNKVNQHKMLPIPVCEIPKEFK